MLTIVWNRRSGSRGLRNLAACAAELKGSGEASKAAADDDDVIHGDGLRVADGVACPFRTLRGIVIR